MTDSIQGGTMLNQADSDLEVDIHLISVGPFDLAEKAELIEERILAGNRATYNSFTNRIDYFTVDEAMKAYGDSQNRAAERHKVFRSSEANRDVGDAAIWEWYRRDAVKWSNFWKRTHRFVSVPKPSDSDERTRSDYY